jgi:hypothetical protein
MSIIGSTEGLPREVGPPRRAAGEVVLAIESALEIVELRSTEFQGHGAKAWFSSRAAARIRRNPPRATAELSNGCVRTGANIRRTKLYTLQTRTKGV